MWIVLIVLGVATEIVRANSWFVVPEICTQVLFGLGGFLAIAKFAIFLYAKSQLNSVSKRFHKH